MCYNGTNALLFKFAQKGDDKFVCTEEKTNKLQDACRGICDSAGNWRSSTVDSLHVINSARDSQAEVPK